MKENAHIFYVPEVKNSTSGDLIFFSGQEAVHCSKVLRLKAGDSIILADGYGKMYDAKINLCQKDTVSAVVGEVLTGFDKRTFYNHIAIAPTKNSDRFEWFLEKAVEFGVDEITPLLCYHSERKSIRVDRMEKILLSALKQSGNPQMPKLNEMESFESFVSRCFENNIVKLIAHCEQEEKVFFGDLVHQNSNVLTLIGPEGDFSKQEIIQAYDNGFKAVSLGNTRLRTETAGIAVCAFLSVINNCQEKKLS